MPQITKRKMAQIRNWNKRLISNYTYSLNSMLTYRRTNIGLTDEEITKLSLIQKDLFNILQTWKKVKEIDIKEEK